MAAPGQPQLDPASLAQILGGGGGFGAQIPGAGGPAPQGQPGDPNMMGAPGGGGQPAGNPTDAAVWQAFPSTDPSAVSQLLQSVQAGGVQGLMQALPQFEQMQQQDEDLLHQKQQMALHAFVDGLIGPNPQAAAGAGQPAPGVGGNSSGY